MGEVLSLEEIQRQARRNLLRTKGKAGPKRFNPVKVPRRHRFTMFPDKWRIALREAKHIATYRLAIYLLRRDWETNGEPIKVTNIAMAEEGVDRRRKREALAELEALGLIKVQRRADRSPFVTLRARK
jgi:hypothetical protein